MAEQGDHPAVALAPALAATAGPRTRAPRGPLFVMVGVSVGIQLLCATLLKVVVPSAGLLAVAMMLGVVGALSFVRFLIWNRIHRAYPVSLAYPLSAILFPAIVVLAWVTGETVGWTQAGGALLVMAGVVRILADPDADEELQ